jgi:hypothetical protein
VAPSLKAHPLTKNQLTMALLVLMETSLWFQKAQPVLLFPGQW